MTDDDLINVDIVLYALYLLGGTRKKVFTEDVAKKSFELFPSRFSWRRYPEYPDIDPTRKRLYEARDVRKLITGRAGEVKGLKSPDGWIFSPKGILWMEKNKARIARLLVDNPKPVYRTDLSKKLEELESSNAYKKFLRGGSFTNIKPYEFTDFLNASLDTPASILKDRIAKVSALAAAGKKMKLLKFINRGQEHFSDLFSS